MEPAPRPRPVQGRRVAGTWVVPLLLIAGCGETSVQPVEPGLSGPIPVPDLDVLQLIHVDVGQGDATLLVGPERTLLVDGGPWDAGRDRVLPVLEARGIATLDWAVATHPHADHVAGLAEVLSRVDVTKGVFDNGDALQTQAYDDYADAAAFSTGGRHTIQPAQVFDLGKGALATCVAVNGRLLDGSLVPGVTGTNDRSVSLLVEWGAFRYLIAGDLGGSDTETVTDVETSLAPLVGDVDVLRVSHHGSRYSTNSTWLNTLVPEVAIVSLGDGNDYGHPHAATLARLTGADPAVTILPVDVFLTERGSAPAPWSASGDVVILARPSYYLLGEAVYDATAR